MNNDHWYGSFAKSRISRRVWIVPEAPTTGKTGCDMLATGRPKEKAKALIYEGAFNSSMHWDTVINLNL